MGLKSPGMSRNCCEACHFATGTNTGAAGMSSSLAAVGDSFGPLAEVVTGGTG